MQPFELPDFYVPWPARLNPNLEIARTHSKAWAQEMGILGTSENRDGPNIWSEHAFDRHDYALFCAYIHPETSSTELNLMTDWNVWAFYVDDYFLQVYKRPKDRAGAKEYLDRVLLFMPVDLSPMPAPTNPTERGLADVWARTAATKSESWRRRIIESTKSLLEASIYELDSMSQQRLANPIEYIEMRRNVGGALWSADLVEHAVFVEIPERIAASRPMQVLKKTFADAVHLRNDIFSYEREVLKEGELTNAVLVIEKFLGVETQHAVNLVNDLLTSRLQQFEHTALTELAPIFDEYGLDPIERTNVLIYIRGLQDWQSGAHEWHIQTSRYLNPGTRQKSSTLNIPLGSGGFGLAAMRITANTLGMNRLKNYMHIPYKMVGTTRLPEFYMPFTTPLNPHLDIARQQSKIWARQIGLLDTLPGHSGVFIWDEHRFDATDLAFFCALAHPNFAATQLDLATSWLVWGTYTDDYFPAVYGRTHDLMGAKICCTRLSEFMPVESGSSTSIPITPIERGLEDLWVRTTKTLSINERRSFRKIIEGMIESWVWELSQQIQNRIPDPIDYIEMRRKTSGSDFIMIIPSPSSDCGMSSEVYRTRTMRELNNAAVDYVSLANDIVSYQKEIEFDGEIHNGVLVIQNFMGCDKIQAIEIVNNLMTARIKQFEHIVATELPTLIENFALGIKEREMLRAQVENLQHFMCGAIQWHIKTNRYKEIEFRRSIKSFTGAPTGLGTAAASCIPSLINNKKSDDVSIRLGKAALPQKEEKLLETSNTVKTFEIFHHTPSFIKKKEEANLTD